MNGIVLNAKTGEPLYMVNIFESNQTGQLVRNVGTTTDEQGRFIAPALQSDYVTFRYVGFQPLTIKNRTGFVKIELTPVATNLPQVTIKPKANKNWLWLLVALGIYKSI